MACVEHVDLQLGSWGESHPQSNSESAKRMVNMVTSALPVAEAVVYAELQREIHYALRAQHPEWVHPNRESPTCDAYESRLAELLRILPPAPMTKNAKRFANRAVRFSAFVTDHSTNSTCHQSMSQLHQT
jgi:uncharacterized membrane protein YgaE (UPF0421/DUF939 family)